MASRSLIAEVAAQIGSALLPNNDQWVNRFQVRSTSSSSLYVVAQRRTDEVWGCSCPGWRHYRRCRHLKDVLRRLTALADKTPSYDKTTLDILFNARTAYLDLSGAKEIAMPKLKAAILDL